MAEHRQKLQHAASLHRWGVVVPHKTNEDIDDVADAVTKTKGKDDPSPSRADKAILARWAAWRPEPRSSTADRRSRDRELSDLADVRIVSKLGPSFLGEARRSPRPRPALGRAASEALRRWREIEEESGRCERRGIGTDVAGAAAADEGERVRRMARRWMSSSGSGGGPGGEAVNVRGNAIAAVEMDICGETDDGCDAADGRVRRHLLRLRGREARLELIVKAVRERQRELQDVRGFRRVSGFPFRGRLQSLLRGRLFHFATPFGEDKRPSTAAMELIQLRDQHPVTILRKGFIFGLENTLHHHTSNDTDSSCRRNSNSHVMDRSSTHIVIGALNGDPEPSQSRNEYSDVDRMAEEQTMDLDCNTSTQNSGWQLSSDQSGQQENPENTGMEWEREKEVGSRACHTEHGEVPYANWQLNVGNDWPGESPRNNVEDGDHSEKQETFYETDFNLAIERVQDDFGTSRSEQPYPMRSINASVPLDYRTVTNMELRQLLLRRSVSNIRSEFRDSLNRLVQSFIERQNQPQSDWDLQQNLQNPYLYRDDHGQQGNDPISEQENPIRSIQLSASPTAPSYPICNWDHHRNLVPQSMCQSEIESEVVNDLKAEVAKLQEGMTQIQQTLDACLAMQQELQRSMRQEVSAALNRCIAGKGIEEALKECWTNWVRSRKGTCCICCDSPINSLLYRCGHMCTCYQCGSEVLRNEGKCPLCRAPIIEVIQAYSSVR